MNIRQTILASGPVIVENNKVLLNQHGDTDFWKFCGGSAKDFSKRLTEITKERVLDEMGIDVEILSNEPYIQYTTKQLGNGITADIILTHFLAKRLTEIKPREDIRQWAWVSLNDLEKENLAPNIIPALKHFGFIE